MWENIVKKGHAEDYVEQSLRSFEAALCFGWTSSSSIPAYVFHHFDMCPLLLEAYNGNKELVELFIRYVASLKNQGLLQKVLNETLAMGIMKHHVEIIRFILEKGADANTVTPVTKTSILRAICTDFAVSEETNIEIVKLLIQYGGKDLDEAMCGASTTHRLDLLRYLLSVGGTATGKDKYTASSYLLKW